MAFKNNKIMCDIKKGLFVCLFVTMRPAGTRVFANYIGTELQSFNNYIGTV
jgi:hypothetical protein